MVTPAKIKQYGRAMREVGLVKLEMEGLTLIRSDFTDYVNSSDDWTKNAGLGGTVEAPYDPDKR